MDTDKDIELGRLPPPHNKRRANDHDAIEVRFQNDPAKLLGWVKEKVAVTHKDVVRGATVYPFHFGALSEGCMVGGQIMIATDVLEACMITAREMVEGPTSLPHFFEQANPWPLYATHRELYEIRAELVARVVRWRYLPITMDLFDQLFDLPDFVPAGTEDAVKVTNLQWVRGDDVGKIDFLPGSRPRGGKTSEPGSLLKPATKAPITALDPFGAIKTDPRLLADLRAVVDVDPLRSVTGGLTNATAYDDWAGATTVTNTTYETPAKDALTADKIQEVMASIKTQDVMTSMTKRMMDMLRPRW